MMMYLSHKKKVLLSAAVLFALASGEAFASSYHGGTSDVTSSNETLDELYATNKAGHRDRERYDYFYPIRNRRW